MTKKLRLVDNCLPMGLKLKIASNFEVLWFYLIYFCVTVKLYLWTLKFTFLIIFIGLYWGSLHSPQLFANGTNRGCKFLTLNLSKCTNTFFVLFKNWSVVHVQYCISYRCTNCGSQFVNVIYSTYKILAISHLVHYILVLYFTPKKLFLYMCNIV